MKTLHPLSGAKIPPVILALFLIDIALCVAYVGNYLIGQPSTTLSRLLDLDGESSVAAWYSSTAYFCVFILAAMFAMQKHQENVRSISLLLLPVLFLLMSLDESARIHEWIGERSDALLPEGNRKNILFSETGIWMFIVGIPFIGIFLWLMYSMKEIFADKLGALTKLITGMTVMLLGAIGIETFSNFVEGGGLIAEVTVEEGLEMVGITIMIWAMYDVVFGPYTRLSDVHLEHAHLSQA